MKACIARVFLVGGTCQLFCASILSNWHQLRRLQMELDGYLIVGLHVSMCSVISKGSTAMCQEPSTHWSADHSWPPATLIISDHTRLDLYQHV